MRGAIWLPAPRSLLPALKTYKLTDLKLRAIRQTADGRRFLTTDCTDGTDGGGARSARWRVWSFEQKVTKLTKGLED
jgi:hypothetical protein